MRRIVTAIAIAAALTGCGATQFTKPGGTPAEFDQAKAECKYQAQLHASDNPILWPNIVRSCLEARGWVGVR